MLDSVWILFVAGLTSGHVWGSNCYTSKGGNKDMNNDGILYEFSPFDHYLFNNLTDKSIFEKEHPQRTQWTQNWHSKQIN